jgi:hypothetical protein
MNLVILLKTLKTIVQSLDSRLDQSSAVTLDQNSQLRRVSTPGSPMSLAGFSALSPYQKKEILAHLPGMKSSPRLRLLNARLVHNQGGFHLTTFIRPSE